MKNRLNHEFLDFTKKVEQLNKSLEFKFDIPFHELSFAGQPHKETVQTTPCAHCLVSLHEWPALCISASDIEVVVFERATNMRVRDFDMAIVKKDLLRES